MLVLILFKSRLSNPSLVALFFIISVSISCQTLHVHSHSQCTKGCDLALAIYDVWRGSNIPLIAQLFSIPISDILAWNPVTVPDQYSVVAGSLINIPFTCDCINGDFLAHIFNYSVSAGDTYDSIASLLYSNLTTPVWLQRFNSYPGNNIPDNAVLNVSVNCSCGDKVISKDYGLFITWPIREGDTLESVAAANNLSADVVRRYNPTANFVGGSERGLLYIPAKGVISRSYN